MSDAYVPYNPQYEQQKYDALKLSIDAAYNNALLKTGNQRLAEQAAKDAADAGAQLISIYGNQGIQALHEATQAGLGVADLLSRLQGPSNAFAYDRAINGINSSGLSNAIGALTGSYRPPAFKGMGPTSPLTLDALAGDTSGGSSSVIDHLLGISSNAQQQQVNTQGGNLPFSIPQYDPGGSGNVTQNSAKSGNHPAVGTSTTVPPAVAPAAAGPSVVNNHFYNSSPTGDTHTGFILGTPQYSSQAQQYLNALPDPSQANARGFAHLNPYSQQVALSGYAAKGYDPQQVQGQFSAMLPQFGAPRVGLVS